MEIQDIKLTLSDLAKLPTSKDVVEEDILREVNRVTAEFNQWLRNLPLQDRMGVVDPDVQLERRLTLLKTQMIPHTFSLSRAQVDAVSVINTRYKGQEDRMIATTTPFGDLFCIFDGHRGAKVSKWVVENFPRVFELAYMPDPKEHLKRAFASVDPLLREAHIGEDCGTTATVCFRPKGTKKLLTGQLGDSDVRTVRNESIGESLNWASEEELQRLENLGGEAAKEASDCRQAIAQGKHPKALRPCNLNVSRAFGNFDIKKDPKKGEMLISEPTITEREIENGFSMVLASDGLWDVVKIIHRFGGSPASQLAGFAKARCKDNIAVMVVTFGGLPSSK